jgi:hypothetical protein
MRDHLTASWDRVCFAGLFDIDTEDRDRFVTSGGVNPTPAEVSGG